MDDALGWGVMWTLALTITAIVVPVAVASERTRVVLYVYAATAASPLVVITLAWSVMADPSDGWRRVFAISMGALAGAAVLFILTETWHGKSLAQTPPSNPVGPHMPNSPTVPSGSPAPFIQNNGRDGTIFNNPTINVNPPAPRAGDRLYQNGQPVAMIEGPHINEGAKRVSFDRMWNSHTLDYKRPVEFRGYVLGIVDANFGQQTLMGISQSGQMATNIAPNVVFEILGAR